MGYIFGMSIAFNHEIEDRLTFLAKQLEPPTNKSMLLVSIAKRAAQMDAIELREWLNQLAPAQTAGGVK